MIEYRHEGMTVASLHDERTGSFQYVVVDEATKAAAIIDPVLDFDPRAVEMLKSRMPDQELNEGRMRMARIPAGADLIANSVSKAPGFRLGNVFVMAGVPAIMHVMLDAVTPLLVEADVTFGNLEGVLMDGGEPVKQCKNPKICFLFRSPARYARYFELAGFDVMSLANNHARDFGEEGRDASMAVTLHDRVAIADVLGEGRFEQRLAAGRIALVPGGDVIAGDRVEVGHCHAPSLDRFDMSLLAPRKSETNYA